MGRQRSRLIAWELRRTLKPGNSSQSVWEKSRRAKGNPQEGQSMGFLQIEEEI